MKLSPISSRNNYFKNCSNIPNFASFRDVYTKTPPQEPMRASICQKSGSKLTVCHQTKLFREDIKWHDLAKYFSEKFKDRNKVNIYNYGCSNGSEAYSIVMALKMADEKPEKFFPIYAKDIIPEAMTQKTEIDREHIIRCLEIAEKYPDFFHSAGSNMYISHNITDNVEFSFGNILEDIDFIDLDNPSIVFARNMWPYIDKKYYSEYANNLYKKLAADSVVVIGYFDYPPVVDINRCNYFPDKLIEAGFSANPVAKFSALEALVFEKSRSEL